MPVDFDKRVQKDPALKEKFKVIFRDGLIYEHVDLNERNPILADKNVRKALLYALDREKLSKALFAGKQDSNGADEKNRTSTASRQQASETCASTSSATSARS